MSNLQNDPDNLDLEELENELENEFEDLGQEEEEVGLEEFTSLDGIRSMIETVLAGNLVESKESFSNILSAKIALKLEEARIDTAKKVFGTAGVV